jgi:kynurenine 3-monooxygenase
LAPEAKPILIVGAGLAGCLMAIELARLGYRVLVFEKRSREASPLSPKRSINLALAPSTLHLLRHSANFSKELRTIITKLRGRVVHAVSGKPEFHPYAITSSHATLLNPAANAVSVSRSELNSLLRSAAASRSNVELCFGQNVIECDADRAVLGMEDLRGKCVSVEGEIVIAADGAHSSIRKALIRSAASSGKSGPRLREDCARLKHSYKELAFTPSSVRAMRKEAFHIWPRAGFLLMALPNRDGTFRGALFLPEKGRSSFSSLKSEAAIRRFFETHFPDAVSNIPNLSEQLRRNTANPLISVRCDPWHVGRTVLVGDACHTLYPFSGHGANLALEDCVHFRECAEQSAPDWERVFWEFTKRLKPRADYLCEATRAVSSFVLNALPQKGILGNV